MLHMVALISHEHMNRVGGGGGRREGAESSCQCVDEDAQHTGSIYQCCIW